MLWLIIPLAYALEIKSKSFKIVQFTDLHYGEGDTQNKQNMKLQSTILGFEKPDMVVITGDMVSGYSWNGELGWYKEYHKMVIQPMKDHNIPWAIALGNHDIEADLNGEQIIELEKQEPLSLAKQGPSYISHYGNYVVPITYKGKLEFLIWILDSGDKHHCGMLFGYDCVHEDQLEWVKNTQKVINDIHQKEIPGLMFMHIPPPEYMKLWDNYNARGNKYEPVSCWGNHTEYFIEALSGILGISVGHDHYNDYEGIINGVKMFYGRKSGYAGNGPEPFYPKGARVFEVIPESKTVNSWIREESGNVVVHSGRAGNFEKQSVCVESSRLGLNLIIGAKFLLGILGLAMTITGCYCYVKRHFRIKYKDEHFSV
ncbi:unnamed protein product [Blepharisma stoltei]|uniref:Calcineurin-like phosphoesterase domain-containing protein n=1 Tax=Blepharisma stoltei TaxID=1481888 RepID=A0AAU9KEE0_9CILI|nr:unnamed protein product [Blepharisma stoltei]